MQIEPVARSTQSCVWPSWNTVRLWERRIVSVLFSVPRALLSPLYTVAKRICSTAHVFFSHCFQPEQVAPNTRIFRIGLPSGTNRLAASGAPIPLDPTMVQLQKFIENLATLMANSLYNHFIQPAVQAISTDSNLPNEIVAKWQALTFAIAQALANALASAFDASLNSLDTRAKTALFWLLSKQGSGSSDTLFNALRGATADSVTDDYLRAFVSALSDKKWLTTNAQFQAPAPAGSSTGFLQSLLVTAIQTLVNGVLYACTKQFCSFVSQTDLQACIQANGTLIGQIIGTRFATLIQTSTMTTGSDATGLSIYRQSYDKIVQILYNQTNAVVNSGGDLAKFADQDACDSIIHEILNPPAGSDPAVYQQDVESALSLLFATQFATLLLPDARTTTNGLTETIPGVIVLLKQLQLPNSIQTAIQDFLQWPQDLFPDGAPPAVANLFDTITYFLQKGLGACLTDQIDTGLGIGLNLGMNMVVPPIYLTMRMVKGAFPALFPALIKSLIAIHLQSAGDTTAGHFKPLAQSSADRATIYATLVPYLQGIAQDMCKKVPFDSVGVTAAVFAEQITPVLDQIADFLVQSSGNKAADSHDIKKWLAAFSQPVDAGSNSIYGQLLVKLMFQLGNLKALGNEKFSEFICQNFLQGLMSKSLTSALNPLRTDEQLIVGGILNGLGNIMSTQDEVDALLFNNPTPAVDMSAQLATQLSQISWFIYSIIDNLINQIPDHSNWFTRTFKQDQVKLLKELIPSHGDINDSFNRVYAAILGNHILNENLYIQVVRTILAALQNANMLISSG